MFISRLKIFSSQEHKDRQTGVDGRVKENVIIFELMENLVTFKMDFTYDSHINGGYSHNHSLYCNLYGERILR